MININTQRKLEALEEIVMFLTTNYRVHSMWNGEVIKIKNMSKEAELALLTLKEIKEEEARDK